jgi:hypothetical protein
MPTRKRIDDDGVYTYAYNAERGRVRRTHKSTGDYEEYSWDHRNRLSRVARFARKLG